MGHAAIVAPGDGADAARAGGRLRRRSDTLAPWPSRSPTSPTSSRRGFARARGDQPGPRLRGRGRALREPAQRLLAAAPRVRPHPRESRPAEQRELLGSRDRDHQRRPADDARLGRPPIGRLRGLRGAARAARPRAAARRAGVRRQGGVPRRVRRATGPRRPGAQARDTRLFVLPSTSPANAAVPWAERSTGSASSPPSWTGHRRYADSRRARRHHDRTAGRARDGRRDRGPATVHAYHWEWSEIPGGPRGRWRLPWFGIFLVVFGACCCSGSCSRRSRPRARCCCSRSASRSSSRGAQPGDRLALPRAIITALAAPDLLAAAGIVSGAGRRDGLPRRRVPVHRRRARRCRAAGWAGRRRWA